MAAEKREIEIALRSRGAEASADRLNKKVQSIGSSADSAENSMLSLTRVAAAVGSALATNQVIAYADAWTNVNNRLRSATSNSLEFTRAQQGVLAIAQQAGVDLSGVADGYSRIAQNTSELGISQERLLDVTRKVTLAIKAGGATAQEASSVIVQLGQGLGAGALQGDELRSIMEASIPITKALAKEFGVTTGELKKLGSEGRITADRVISAIEGMDESAITFTKDISSGFTEVNNALTVYVGNLDESLGVTNAVTASLSGVAENIDLVVNGATALVAIIGARYVGALASAIAAQAMLTTSSLKATTQVNFLGQVVNRTTVSMQASAVAARGLSAALSFIGGPVGVALVAAAAIVYFADEAETAEEKSRRLAGEVDNLKASFIGLTDAQRSIEIKKINQEFKQTQNELVKATEKLNQFKLFADSPIKTQSIRDYEAQIVSLNKRLDELSTKRSAVFEAGLPSESEFSDLSSGKPKGKTGDSPPPKGAGSDFVNRIKLETQAYAAELEIRRQLNEGSITEQQASDALELQNILFSYEAKRQAILEQEFQTEQLKQEALEALREQELTSIRLFEEEKTNIKSDGDEQRLNLEKSYSQQVQAMQIAVAKQAVNLIRGFVGESKAAKIALIALDKGLAIAQTIINSQVASTRALAELGPIKGAPVSAKMLTLGKISAGIIAATGLGEAFASSGGGGGSIGSIGSSAPSAPSPSFAPAPSVQNQSQQRTINITGLDGIDDDQPIPLTVGGLKSLLSSDENVNIAINQGQQNAQRVGAI
jgi:tape measure domain-containing protein